MTSGPGNPTPARPRVVVRVRLRDRPGALGAVASRIGAIGADISAVDVLESDGEWALDEFSVVLPSIELLPLLHREIGEVDGVEVEACRVVTEFRDHHLEALEVIDALSGADSREELHRRLADTIRHRFGAAWVGVMTGGNVGALAGDAPAAVVAHESARHDPHTTSTHRSGDLELVVARTDDEMRRREQAVLDVIVVIAHRWSNRLGG